MKRLNIYINKLVNLTIKNKLGHNQMLSGYITNVGKQWILFIDTDGTEHPYKRELIQDVKIITSK
jgi:hypothetical protein